MKWTVLSLVKRAAQILSERGIETARLDAELLMCHLLGWNNRIKIYTEHDRPLTPEEVEKYRRLIIRRAKGEPVAYIVGYKEFFGLKFKIKRGVLIPRPETEILVEKTLEKIHERFSSSISIIDVGTGSGCIIISLCKNIKIKNCQFFGTDISDISLKIAKQNARDHGCKVKFIKSNLLEKINFEADVIVSNPPYISTKDQMVKKDVVKFEPHEALFSGKTGLETIERLSFQSYRKLKIGGFLSLEFGFGQSKRVSDILKRAGFLKIEVFKDLSGIERVAIAYKE